MLERTLCAAIPSLPERSTCTVFGWVTAARRLGGLTFVVLRDRSGSCQVLLDRGAPPPPEAVVRISGATRTEPRAPAGVELHATECEIIAAPAAPPPFALHRSGIPASLETVLEHRGDSLRHPAERAVFAIQAALARGFRRHLDSLGFTETHTPKIVGAATEGGAEVFAVDYFGRPAHLAQSPQLYKQVLVGAGFERVYEVGAVYRAEPHATARHLSEYVSMDVETELFGGGGAAALIALERGVLAAMFDEVRATCAPALPMLAPPPLPDPATAAVVPRAEALRRTGRRRLDPEAERALCEELGEMVFVTDWPSDERPFYTLEAERAPGRTESFDLILRGLEVTTGGQREHRQERLAAAMRLRGVPETGFEDYLQAFARGMPPHGGFAIGLERLTARLLGLPNVRRASLFPRDRQRLRP